MKPTTSLTPRRALQQMKPYSPGKPIWEVQQEFGLTDVVKLASNENPLGPSPKAVQALSSALLQLHRYPDAQSVHLREAIAEHAGVNADQVIVTNGGDELITLLSEAFLEPDDEIIVPSPSFTEYEFGGKLMGAAVKRVPLTTDYRYDIGAISQAVNERTKIVYLCSPNNPTGTILTKSELDALAQQLPEQALIVLDAAYSHFVTDDSYSDGLEIVQAGYPLLMINTFSKVFGLAGIRVGYGIAPRAVIESILQVKEPFNVNALAQTAALAALADEEHISLSRQLVVQERERLYASFERLRLPFVKSMSNFILVELGEQAERIYEQLMREGVIVRYAAPWGLPRHVRVSIGLPEENDRFVEVLQTLL